MFIFIYTILAFILSVIILFILVSILEFFNFRETIPTYIFIILLCLTSFSSSCAFINTLINKRNNKIHHISPISKTYNNLITYDIH